MEKLAMEYGDGLFALAEEEGVTEELLQQTKTLRDVLLANPGYISLLTSRKLEKSEKDRLLEECFSGRVHPYLYNFLRLMNDRDNFAYVGACCARFEERYFLKKNVLRARVYSAAALAEEEKKKIAAALEKKTGKTVHIRWETDPSLLAGIRVEADGLLIESSAKQRIEQMRRHLGASIT